MPAKQKHDDDQLSDDVKAAIAETVAEQHPIEVELNGHTYEADRKMLGGIRFRLALQKGQDTLAVEMLLGPLQFEQFIENEGDELQAILDFFDALGKAVGAGNS